MTLLDLLPFVAVAAIMWLLLIRPARKRQQEQTALLSSLRPGQRVMTTSGLLGTIVSTGDEIAIEVADGVVVRFVPQAIARVIPVEPAPEVAPGTPDVTDLREPAGEAAGDAPRSE